MLVLLVVSAIRQIVGLCFSYAAVRYIFLCSDEYRQTKTNSLLKLISLKHSWWTDELDVVLQVSRGLVSFIRPCSFPEHLALDGGESNQGIGAST